MPLVQWIMQNLQPLVAEQGVVLDGVAIVKTLANLLGSGEVLLSGNADVFVLQANKGVKIDGFAEVAAEFNVVSTGEVLLNGEAAVEFIRIVKNRITYLPGDTVYTADGKMYTVIGFYHDVSDHVRYEITNSFETGYFYEEQLFPDREAYFLSIYVEASEAVNTLSS